MNWQIVLRILFWGTAAAWAGIAIGAFLGLQLDSGNQGLGALAVAGWLIKWGVEA